MKEKLQKNQKSWKQLGKTRKLKMKTKIREESIRDQKTKKVTREVPREQLADLENQLEDSIQRLTDLEERLDDVVSAG